MTKCRPRKITKLLFGALTFFLVSIVAQPVNAQKPRATKSSKNGVTAVVVVDGALVHVQPDPDSRVIGQLAEGTRVQVSSGTTSGPEKYRKIRVGPRIGYISDIDIRIGTAPLNKDTGTNRAVSIKEAARKAAAKRRMNEKQEEIFFSRFIGVFFGTTEFKEGINNVEASDQLSIYGLKITGPDVILRGPIIDFTLALHYGAPSYYGALSETRPTGFVLMSDMLLLMPFSRSQDWMIYGGIGPMLMFSKFGVVNSGRNMDLQEINLGATFDIGGALRIQKVVLRLEAKYVIEKRSYRGALASVQMQF